MSWYFEVLQKYADFDGRAPRAEYWMFTLVNLLVVFTLAFLEALAGGPGIVWMLYVLAVALPSIGVSIRRLHDTGRSGWWLLLSFIPFGGLVLLIFYLMDGEAGDNQYGPNPKVPAPGSSFATR